MELADFLEAPEETGLAGDQPDYHLEVGVWRMYVGEGRRRIRERLGKW